MDQLPVVLVGAHGHGRWHLRNLRRLATRGVVRLVGVCDRLPVAEADLADFADPVQSSDLAQLLDRTRPAITVLATPIHTHLPLARIALDHGSHVLLEKPPTATLADYEELVATVERGGPACQVGFQSLGSEAIRAVEDLIASGAVGTVRGIGGAGAWVRTSAYYERAAWAGRRRLAGEEVVDGALTNPFAHAVATALRLAGATRAIAADRIELELFHAHGIESDDTSCLRVRGPDGTTLSLAVTLCASERHEPYLIVHGSHGRVTLRYTLDEVELHRFGHPPQIRHHPRTDLLENLIAHVRGEDGLLVPLSETRGFMHVLEAVRRAPDPRPIPDTAQRITTTGDGLHRHVRGVEDLVTASAECLALYSELYAPWARPSTAPSHPTTR